MDQELDRITVPAGTVVKIDGMPFELAGETVVLGLRVNFDSLAPTVTCQQRYSLAGQERRAAALLAGGPAQPT